MVAVIKAGYSLHRIFNYNENKVKEGVAQCIGAENYPLEAAYMSVKTRIDLLLKRVALNENVRRNSVHISLNFDPSEKDISKEKLMEITKTYMDRLGFGEQPYLVYQHHDAGHPHLHIVTTNIKTDGRTINLHHLGIRKSEPARLAIEQLFGLVAASSRQKKEVFQLKPVDARKVQYGHTETRKAMAHVLDTVLESYCYTSLAELNAVLKLYNVTADRGTENSRLFKHQGLVYRVLDASGNPVGVPIKASAFYNKPILKSLERKFARNELKRLPHKARLKNIIDMALLGKEGLSMDRLMESLKRRGVDVLLRQNEEGFLYGITYIDHLTKSVFNGSALGKNYSAQSIAGKCAQQVPVLQNIHRSHLSQQLNNASKPWLEFAPETNAFYKEQIVTELLRSPVKLLDALLQQRLTPDYIAGYLKPKRKKKKRKQLSHNQ